MAISEAQFKVLVQLQKNDDITQREMSEKTGISLGKVNSILADFRETGIIDEMNRVTEAGSQTLAPYRVTNAVIMAAGMSSRFAPLSYEKPKALLNVKGEVLIEREIRQLHEAGITDITLVVGYMKEKMYYLAEKYNLNIVVNEDYYRYNNTSTLIRVLDKLDNTYICSSDNYFTENVFEPFVYRSYYSAVYAVGETGEYCLDCNKDGRIRKVTIGGSDAWYMLGHVYWDRSFSEKFKKILLDSYEDSLTKTELWENLYMRHIKELDLYIQKYPDSVIKEFDSLDELREFDENYISNADSKIFNNIKNVLGCEDSEISHIVPIKSGLTNTSFRFDCKGKSYVYRHPGPGTEKYINRTSEAASMEIAKELGIDDTYIYINPKEGWKISHYVEDARILDYDNEKEVENAFHMVRKLHTCGKTTNYHFDVWQEIEKFYESLHDSGRDEFEGAKEIQDLLTRVRTFVTEDHFPECICHCDCYNPNFLIDKKDKMYLIDWEYSGMSDPASDIGTFIACSPYDLDRAEKVIQQYLGHKPTVEELRHYIAYVAIMSYYWFIWSLYQDSVGKPVGEWQYLWYKSTKVYAKRAIELYEG